MTEKFDGVLIGGGHNSLVRSWPWRSRPTADVTLQRQRHVHDRGLFGRVPLGNSGRRRCRRPAANIDRPLVGKLHAPQKSLQPVLNIMPSSHVFRLLLAPNNFCLREASQFVDQGLDRERIQLLQAQQVDAVQPAPFPFFIEVVVNLARAQHDPLDAVVGPERNF